MPNRKILVIDDDNANRAALAFALRQPGYEILMAENGNVGLKMCETEQVDLVITDILMPETDGIEVILALRQYDVIPKVIAMTGGGRWCGMEMLQAAKMLGADAVVSKPCSLPHLERVLVELLDADAEELAQRDHHAPAALNNAA